MPEVLPMFPLNAGLIPGALLPLRVFEERYLRLLDDCLASDREFGVVLISRGSEVGGGDQRYDVGTVASIIGLQEQDDGTRLVVGRGTARLRVEEWLEDDPYPRAVVERLEDRGDVSDQALTHRLERAFARGLGLISEMGVDVGAAPDLPDDPAAAVYMAIAMLPIEALDRQRLLEMDDIAERLEAAVEVVEDANELLAVQLGGS